MQKSNMLSFQSASFTLTSTDELWKFEQEGKRRLETFSEMYSGKRSDVNKATCVNMANSGLVYDHLITLYKRCPSDFEKLLESKLNDNKTYRVTRFKAMRNALTKYISQQVSKLSSDSA